MPEANRLTPRGRSAGAAGLRALHMLDASCLQLAGDRLTALVGSPTCVALLFITIPVWIGTNLAMILAGLRRFDPPPFVILQTIAAISALAIAALILMTQRHEDRLLDQRAQLMGVRFMSGLWLTEALVVANQHGDGSSRAASDAARAETNRRHEDLRT